MGSLLPPIMADTECKALEGVMERLRSLPPSLAHLYDPDTCPEAVLPILALQWGVLDEAWALADTVPLKRALVKRSLMLQRSRGTPWALKEALASVGWPGMTIVERMSSVIHDGSRIRNGSITYSSDGAWSAFQVRQMVANDKSVSSSEIARIQAAINAWKPARCTVESIRLEIAFASQHAALTGNLEIGAGHGAPTYRRPVLSNQGGIVTFVLDTTEGNTEPLDTFAIFQQGGGTPLVTATRAPISKTNTVSITGTWTIG